VATDPDAGGVLNFRLPLLGRPSPKPHPPSRVWAMIWPAQTPVLKPQQVVSQSASAWHTCVMVRLPGALVDLGNFFTAATCTASVLLEENSGMTVKRLQRAARRVICGVLTYALTGSGIAKAASTITCLCDNASGTDTSLESAAAGLALDVCRAGPSDELCARSQARQDSSGRHKGG
jgi:hypothetical protein